MLMIRGPRKREEHAVMPCRLLIQAHIVCSDVHKQHTEHFQPAWPDMLVPWYMYSYASHMCYVSRFLPGGHEERTAVPQTPPKHSRAPGYVSPVSSIYTDLINIALAAAVLLARPRRPRGWQHSLPDETRIPTRKEVRVTPLHWRYCACCPRDGSTRVCPHVEAFAHCLPPVLVWRTVSCLDVPVVVCLFW